MEQTTTLTPDPAVRLALAAVPGVDFKHNLRAARAGGRTYVDVIKEMVKVSRGPGKLTPQEYFYFRLWDGDLSIADKLQFVGKARQAELHAACNEVDLWGVMVDDKLLFHEAMRGGDFPVPELLAVVHTERRSGGVPAIAGVDALRAFLTEECPFPVFGKPLDGVFSLGVFRADAYDAGAEQLVMHDGTRVAVDDCVTQIASYSQGYLLQKVLQSQSEIAARFGDRLWSVRFLVFLTPDGPAVARAVCKIPTGTNIADNFWRTGNMLAAVDIATGKIVRTVRGTGPAMEIGIPHPDTNEPIVGTVVPDWNAAVALCLEAATTLPGINTQSWDIALTDRGPVILEANLGGDLNLAQLAWGKGVLDDAYRAHAARFGLKV